jgi:hypothetical protein
MSRPIVEFQNRKIYLITPVRAINATVDPFIIQWIDKDRVIDFNNKDEIIGQKTLVKSFFISDFKNHGLPIHNANLNTPISLNNIKSVETTNLVIGHRYIVGQRLLFLRGFSTHHFYVSENQYTNNYETFHNVPIDESKQIFSIPICYLSTTSASTSS